MSVPAHLTFPPLSPDEWSRLLKELEVFAATQLRQHRWRLLPGGVPPDGFDAPSLASEAIRQYLNDLHHPDDSVHHLTAGVGLKAHLRRSVRRALDRLRRRKENRLLINDPDLPPLLLPDGHSLSPVEACPSDDPPPDLLLIQKEEDHVRAQLQQRFLASLAGDPPLQHFCHRLLNAQLPTQPHHRPLTLSWRAVDNLRKRLQRRFRAFCPETTAQAASAPKPC